MKSVSISEARKRLGTVLDDAQRRPVVISRGGRDIAVVVSISEYNRLRSGLVQAFLNLRNSVAAEAGANGLTEKGLAHLLEEGDP